MSKTAHNGVAELRALYQLIDECRSRGDDPRVWRGHYSRGIGQLISADLVFCVETGGCRALRPVVLGVADWGRENDFDQAGWPRARREFLQVFFSSFDLQRYFPRFHACEGIALSRCDLIADRDGDRTFDDPFIHRTIGVDHVLWCFRSIPELGDTQAGVIALRQKARRDFDPAHKTILEEAQSLVAPLVGGPLARFTEPSPSDLPLRARQVLRCLLEGERDKQVAARLGLSPLTVNVHTKAIYRHFGVSGRVELLARWVHRRWGVGRWDRPRVE
jgi:DNA-binding CsgD family transcriptional regulator